MSIGALPPVASATDDFGALRVGPELLVQGSHDGPLTGLTAVVKDLFDVAGHRTGAGNPDYLAGAEVAASSAWAVQGLVDAGASIIGKSHTDELAFSLSGTNVHYGTPTNPRAPGRIPGGSSSGSAVAVSAGLVPLALGTDTGGSIRVPASYCGVFGFRPSHGRIPVTGLVPLVPRFDTVGLLASDGAVLRDAGIALLQAASGELSVTRDQAPGRIVIADDLMRLADPDVSDAVISAVEQLALRLDLPLSHGDVSQGRAQSWRGFFMARQLADVWQTHGDWVDREQPSFGPGIAERMGLARGAASARGTLAELGRAEVLAALDRVLPVGAVLALPSASTVAPPIEQTAEQKGALRMGTLALTCLAGLGGLPAVSLPLAEVDGLPVGVCLLARPGDDERLLDIAARLSDAAPR
ncbi:amidase [Microbacterium allomyrinae]|uniref:Amidase n=1 Tax=Microbacterium allomyrinae TaxID=2830666 RepID=A0A9X1S4L7_9MICO|nr:amidase [Microbacterium allomyrinae]MCC2033135.1 amidase [Microbacterium allomyrinae]